MSGDAAPRPGWREVPGAVWALGFVSLFMDISSELIHALLPLLLVDRLGVGVAHGRADRGHRRGDRNHHQGLLRRAVRTGSAGASCWR